ncbi:MAG: PEP-CTERM sorting domain-containing protein [Planctomycetota bacterium]|nr:MAG: PEP-CTERM sorting domain-containing protein [Planctomycetota bacterium]
MSVDHAVVHVTSAPRLAARQRAAGTPRNNTPRNAHVTCHIEELSTAMRLLITQSLAFTLFVGLLPGALDAYPFERRQVFLAFGQAETVPAGSNDTGLPILVQDEDTFAMHAISDTEILTTGIFHDDIWRLTKNTGTGIWSQEIWASADDSFGFPTNSTGISAIALDSGAPVPEPSTCAMAALALLALGLYGWRRRARTSPHVGRTLCLSSLAVCFFVSTSSSAIADWSQFQGDAAHTGYAPGSIDAPNLTQIWSVDAPPYSGGSGDRSLAIVDGDVYATMLEGYSASGDYHVRRFSGDSGTQLWETTLIGNSHSGVSAPSVANGTVYVHHYGHSAHPPEAPALVGLDIDDGTQRFRTTHSGQWSSGSRPTISGDAVFAAGGYYGGLDAYELDGNHRWFHDVNQQYGWIPAADENHVYVYMGEASASPGPNIGSLYVVDRDTGVREATLLHPTSSGALGSLQTVMLGGNDDVFALTRNSTGGASNVTLVSFDVSTESIRWERHGKISGNPAIANRVIAIPDNTELRFLDQATGADLWAWSAPGIVSGNVVLTDGHAFVNVDDDIHAIDLDSQQSVWSVQGLNGSLAIDDGLLVVGNPDGIYAFSSQVPPPVPEPSTCALLWLGMSSLGLFGWRRPASACRWRPPEQLVRRAITHLGRIRPCRLGGIRDAWTWSCSPLRSPKDLSDSRENS